jgi:transcriptional regulator with XRE-family HTH domain
MPRIGRHLQDLRTRRQLSIRELAKRSGVSHATISLIERDKTSPSIDTLAAMTEALGTTLVAFFDELRNPLPYSPFYAPDELTEIGHQTSISYRMVGSNHPHRQLLMMRETYEVGADTGGGVSHQAQEAGFVLEGKIEISVGPDVKTLTAGEAYYFDSIIPHRFRNVGEGQAVIISAITPPNY